MGFMLVASYTLTTRNQVSAQKAQERAEGIRQAETQLELLRTYADINRLPNDALQPVFCVSPDGSATSTSGAKLTYFTTLPSTDLTTDGSFNGANYPTDCKPTGSLYEIAVWSPVVSSTIGAGSTVGGAPYVITVRWNRASGGRDEVKMFYTIHDTNNPLFGGP